MPVHRHGLFRQFSFLIALSLLLTACGRDNETSVVTVDNIAAPDAAETVTDDRPNIVYILADDLGYGDLGVFGSEIPTPNLDQLAREGMLLTDFHTSLACSPTRSMLMSGTDNHLAGVGAMSGAMTEELEGAPGYEAYLNFRVASLADLMTDAGYNTYMTGKWHLGTTDETLPKARGFKRSFISLDGAAHLGGLSWDGPGLATYVDDGERVTVGDDFYTTDFYTTRMIDYIEQDKEEGKPFFAYLAYTTPHWPLQAPAESIAKFEGWYDEGYEEIYRTRFNRMQELGLIPEDAAMYDDSVWQNRWEDLTDEEKRYSARVMEIYAAMVSDLDTYVGVFIDYLKEIGEYDNTFIIFSSDNGAENVDRAAAVADWVETCCDNSYENLGAPDSYLIPGEDWATAQTVAHRRHKGTAFEGGMRVPAFAWFPQMIEPGQSSDGFGSVMDLLPTFLELAGSEHPGTSYRGQEVLPVQGKSLLPILRGEVAEVHTDEDYMGWELHGHRAVRQGDWKITWDNAAGEDARWMLFNLVEDQGETTDLSAEYPNKLDEMISLWDRYAEENGVIY